jgi:3-isopropylmalate dehydratase small subunit
MSKVHDLPHGASIDLESQVIKIPVGKKIVLKFDLDDFHTFYENLDDLKMILDFHTSVAIYECEVCSSATVDMTYDPPKDQDEN